MHIEKHIKPDGRSLYLCSSEKRGYQMLEENREAVVGGSHLVWHPLRSEWVVQAESRRKRRADSPGGYCALCPSEPDGKPTEIPFTDYEVAVFENRYPALQLDAKEPPEIQSVTAKATGVCEIIVYSPEHGARLGSISDAERELVIEAWGARCSELYKHEAIKCVSVFENRGKAVGMSLSHPHGQIYGLPYLPVVMQREVEAFRKEPVIEKITSSLDRDLVIREDEHSIAFIPPFARYSYEVWVAPKKRHPGCWSFSPEERASFSKVLGDVVQRYSLLNGQDEFPYIMSSHVAPKGAEDFYHFHIEFYPPFEPGKKFTTDIRVEFGMWFHLVEASLERSAEHLRTIKD